MNNINVTPEFVLAGASTFTVSNMKGTHYTYHVSKSKPSEKFPNPAYFASVLTGDDNSNQDHYLYIGLVKVSTNPTTDPVLISTAKSKFRGDTERFKILQWALKVIWQSAHGKYRLPEDRATIQHVGNCGRCGAKLTNPASLDTGLGPECAEKVGVPWRERHLTFGELLPPPTTQETVDRLRSKFVGGNPHHPDNYR